MNSIYITTPIYYVNDKPHVGTAYSTVIADILNRYHKYFEHSSFFLTGLDEHGQKCQQTAEAKGIDPQDHCDQMARLFKKTWSVLNIQYDHFYRTTDKQHKTRVQHALQKLYDSGYIYESTYEGWYCVSEEIFYKEKDLVNGLSPEGRKVIKIEEKNYFFKMSQFRDKLIQHLQKNPDFIYPKERQNEVLGFLNQKLDDLCISRPQSRLKWGVKLPFDSDYVSYVWVDALLNYVFGVDLQYDESSRSWNKNSTFNKWWPYATHLIGKDILITHAVYWPCLLMALDIPLPDKIISHGWLLNKEQEKMSKSKGDTLDPLTLAQEFGVDPLRYFFIKNVRFGQDAPISRSLILKEYNDDLVNNLGNLVQRTTTLIKNYFDEKVPKPPSSPHPIQNQAQETCQKVYTAIKNLSLHQAVSLIVELLSSANKLLEDEKPWKQVKVDKEKAGYTLYSILETIRVSTSLLQPIMPETCQEILKRLGINSPTLNQTKPLNVLKEGQPLKQGKILFPRIQ